MWTKQERDAIDTALARCRRSLRKLRKAAGLPVDDGDRASILDDFAGLGLDRDEIDFGLFTGGKK